MHDLTDRMGATDARERSHSEAIATLRREHQVILRALRVAEAMAASATGGRPLDRETLAWLVDFLRTFADRCHHAKEEEHLFPALVRRGVPVEGGPIGVMLAEHEEGRRLIREMAEADDARAAAALRAYVTLLHAHIDKEDNVLFPLADHVLEAREQEDLAQRFTAVEVELLPPGTHERLEAELTRAEGRVRVT